MATDTDDPRDRLDRERELLHHDVQELAVLRETEHRLEGRIEGEVAEIERLERDGRTIDLIVNTRAKPWSSQTIDYDQIVALAALPLPQGLNPGFLVVFEDGPRKNPSGTLVAGQSVQVKNEMVFHVTPTNRS